MKANGLIVGKARRQRSQPRERALRMILPEAGHCRRHECLSIVRRAPDDAQTLVASAVSRFRKDHPERAFSRLGPLAARFPHNQAVRFHLGLLSIWIGDFREARRQLELARVAAPETRLGREAKTLLASLVR